MFFALLIADVIALVMLILNHVKQLKIVLIVGAIVFVVLAAVLFFSQNARERIKKREAKAVAKIADLQDQVDEALSKKNNKVEDNGSSVH